MVQFPARLIDLKLSANRKEPGQKGGKMSWCAPSFRIGDAADPRELQPLTAPSMLEVSVCPSRLECHWLFTVLG